MKNRRMILSLLLSILIVLLACACSDNTGGNKKASTAIDETKLQSTEAKITITHKIENKSKYFKFKDYKCRVVEGGVEISKYLNKENVYPKIPSTIKGQKVVSIGEKAFFETEIEKIKLGKYIRKIGKQAFCLCDDLYDLKLPDSVEEIGDEAFVDTEVLGIKFGNHIKKIGNRAFENKGDELEEIPCADTLEWIGDYAFADTFVDTFKIGKNLKHIGDGVFSNTFLKYIEIDKNNKYFTYDDGVLYDKNKTRLIIYKKTADTFEVPESVTRIAGAAFASSGVHEIKLSNNIKKIGEEAFAGCGDLRSIKLPNEITEIADSMFQSCSSLQKIKLGNKIVRIGESAFESSGIKNITLPNSVRKICRYAFSSSKLRSIGLNASLESIGGEAFAETKIKTINIPKSLKYIHRKAFYNMKKVNAINVSEDNKSFSDLNGVLYNKSKTKLIAYPFGLKRDSYMLCENTKKISPCAFFEHPYLISIVFNNKLKSVGKEAFMQAEKLNSVYLNSELKDIDKRAFWECEKLETYTIPNNIEKIGDDAFSETGIKSLVIDAPRLKLGSGVFSGCNKLEKLTLLSYKSAEDYTFGFCGKLKEVRFGESIKTIYKRDYVECRKLSGITIPKHIKTIEYQAFGYCFGELDEIWADFEFTIKGYKGSAAEKYAKDNKFEFKALG